MKFAIIQNGIVASIIDAQSGFAIPGQTLVACDDSVNRFDIFDGSKFSRPVISPENPTQFAPFDFLQLFTASERQSIEASTDPIVRDAILQLTAVETFIDLTSPTTLQLVGYLLQVGLLITPREIAILAGQPPS